LGQNLTLTILVTNPTTLQSLSKSTALNSDGGSLVSPVNNLLSGNITFQYAELMQLGDNLQITFQISDGITIVNYPYSSGLSLYPAHDLIQEIAKSLNTRFSGHIYMKTTQELISLGFIKLKDLPNDYSIWTEPLYLYQFLDNSVDTSQPLPHPFLVKTIPENGKMGIIKLKK
jgi:hypothetical protein